MGRLGQLCLSVCCMLPNIQTVELGGSCVSLPVCGQGKQLVLVFPGLFQFFSTESAMSQHTSQSWENWDYMWSA